MKFRYRNFKTDAIAIHCIATRENESVMKNFHTNALDLDGVTFEFSKTFRTNTNRKLFLKVVR